MEALETIEKAEDARLGKFRLQKDGLLRQEQEIIVDSARVVERLLKMKIPIKAILLNRDFLDSNLQLISSHGAKVYLSNKVVMESIVGHRIHSGVIAIAQRPKDIPLTELDFDVEGVLTQNPGW